MDFFLSEEQKQIKALVKEFCRQEVDTKTLQEKLAQTVAAETAADIREAFPYDMLEKLDKIGLRQLAVPRQYGGTAPDEDANTTLAIAAEEFGYWGFGIGDIVVIPWFFVRAVATNRYVTDTQKKWFFDQYIANPRMMVGVTASEPAGSTDVHMPYDEGGRYILQVTAETDGDGWIINGDKMFSSGRGATDMVLVAARTDKELPVSRAMSIFWVPSDAPGVSITPNRMVAVEFGGNCQTHYDNVRVTGDHLVGEVNKGFSIIESIFELKCYAVAEFVGALQRLYEDMREYARQRVGGGKPIIKHTAVAAKLGELAINIEALRGIVYRTAWESDQLEASGGRPLGEGNWFWDMASYAMMKQVSWQFCQVAADIYGGMAGSVDLPIENFLRNIFYRSAAGLTLEVELIEASKHYDSRHDSRMMKG
jgi:acyl-CoA dehydrogenase